MEVARLLAGVVPAVALSAALVWDQKRRNRKRQEYIGTHDLPFDPVWLAVQKLEQQGKYDIRAQRASMLVLRKIAMRPQYLPKICSLTCAGVDKELRRRALTTINCLALVEENRREIIEQPGLLASLMAAVEEHDDMVLQRIALQALGSLQINSEGIKMAMVQAGVIDTLIRCTKSSDKRLQYHGSLLLHDFARLPPNREPIVAAGAIPILVPLFGRASTNLQKIILETLIILCINGDNLAAVLSNGVIDPLIGCLRSRDHEVQSLAAAMLHDLALKEENLETLVKAGVLDALTRLATTKEASTRKVVVETLLLFFSSGNHTMSLIKAGALKPFVQVCTHPEIGDSIQYYVAALLYDLTIENSDSIELTDKIVEAGAIKCLTVLCTSARENVQLLAGKAFVFLATSNADAIAGLRACAVHLAAALATAGANSTHSTWSSLANLAVKQEVKEDLISHPTLVATALAMLATPMVGAQVHKPVLALLLLLSTTPQHRSRLLRDGALQSLAAFYRGCNDITLRRDVCSILGWLLRNSEARIQASRSGLPQAMMPLAWSPHMSVQFAVAFALEPMIVHRSDALQREQQLQRVCWNDNDRTQHLKLSLDHLEIRNDAWVFESVRANTPITYGKWYYEVTLLTLGVFQIGWATRACAFTTKLGVGDDEHSYAYDGARVTKWHGSEPGKERMYGEPWKDGDVVGCMLDADAGTIAYSLNGVHLGTAWKGVDVSRGLYPAVSVDTGKQCRVNMGALPFRHARVLSRGYQAIASFFTLAPRSCPDHVTLDLSVDPATGLVAVSMQTSRKDSGSGSGSDGVTTASTATPVSQRVARWIRPSSAIPALRSIGNSLFGLASAALDAPLGMTYFWESIVESVDGYGLGGGAVIGIARVTSPGAAVSAPGWHFGSVGLGLDGVVYADDGTAIAKTEPLVAGDRITCGYDHDRQVLLWCRNGTYIGAVSVRPESAKKRDRRRRSSAAGTQPRKNKAGGSRRNSRRKSSSTRQRSSSNGAGSADNTTSAVVTATTSSTIAQSPQQHHAPRPTPVERRSPTQDDCRGNGDDNRDAVATGDAAATAAAAASSTGTSDRSSSNSSGGSEDGEDEAHVAFDGCLPEALASTSAAATALRRRASSNALLSAQLPTASSSMSSMSRLLAQYEHDTEPADSIDGDAARPFTEAEITQLLEHEEDLAMLEEFQLALARATTVPEGDEQADEAFVSQDDLALLRAYDDLLQSTRERERDRDSEDVRRALAEMRQRERRTSTTNGTGDRDGDSDDDSGWIRRMAGRFEPGDSGDDANDDGEEDEDIYDYDDEDDDIDGTYLDEDDEDEEDTLMFGALSARGWFSAAIGKPGLLDRTWSGGLSPAAKSNSDAPLALVPLVYLSGPDTHVSLRFGRRSGRLAPMMTPILPGSGVASRGTAAAKVAATARSKKPAVSRPSMRTVSIPPLVPSRHASQSPRRRG